MSDIGVPSSHIAFGPRLPDVKPLGRQIRVQIDLKGLRGLESLSRILPEGLETGRHLYQIRFYSIGGPTSDDLVKSFSPACSSHALEGEGLLQGIVQWNETICLDCLELSYLEIDVYSDRKGRDIPVCSTSISIADLLANSKVSHWFIWSKDGRFESSENDSFRLFYSALPIAFDENEQTWKFDGCANTSYTTAEHDSFADESERPESLSAAVVRLLPGFLKCIGLSGYEYPLLFWTHSVYQIDLNPQMCDKPRFEGVLSAIVETMNVIIQSPQEGTRCRREYTESMMCQLDYLTYCVFNIAQRRRTFTSEQSRILLDSHDDRSIFIVPGNGDVSELARLTFIIVAPDPTSGSNSVSASANRHAVFRTLAKDTLLLALEAIAQSSDAFPPLKSAVSGLLFFTTYAEIASSNKKQVRDIYKRVDGLVDSLKHGMLYGASLSPAHQAIVDALATNISVLRDDMENIIKERKSRFKRYLRAKQHREELQDVVWQLDNARMNYITAVATLNAATITKVHNHVEAISLVLNARPRTASGARRADAALSVLRESGRCNITEPNGVENRSCA